MALRRLPQTSGPNFDIWRYLSLVALVVKKSHFLLTVNAQQQVVIRNLDITRKKFIFNVNTTILYIDQITLNDPINR